MTDIDKTKYKERSVYAINGIRQLMSDIQLILSCNTIKGKYYKIAQYIGLVTENEKSYYGYFIPINSDIVFLLRFSDHNNTNPSLYNQHERNGRPNKRFIIPFVGNTFQNSGSTPFLEAEHHVVSYPVNALDDEASIKLFLSDLQRLFTNGETNFTQLPQQPIQENNNNNKYTNKNIMKINESQLRKIIQESVNTVLKERSLDNIEHTDLYGYNDIEDYSDEELVKVAKSGDYTTAFIDYLKELIGPSAENLTLNSFIKDMRSGKIRYCEKNDGIYYINDWSGV